MCEITIKKVNGKWDIDNVSQTDLNSLYWQINDMYRRNDFECYVDDLVREGVIDSVDVFTDKDYTDMVDYFNSKMGMDYTEDDMMQITLDNKLKEKGIDPY